MLTKKQLDLIANVLKCPTFAAAIKQTGVSTKTAYKWKNSDAEFIEELNKRKLEVIESVSVYLQGSLAKCGYELMKIVCDSSISPQIRLNAINSVFQNARSLTEEVDILKRLTELELQHVKEGMDNE